MYFFSSYIHLSDLYIFISSFSFLLSFSPSLLLTISSSHYLTISPSHHLTISPSHHLTISPSHHLTISPSHHLTISPSHHLTISPPHHLTTSPPHHLTTSPPYHLTNSPSYHLTISPHLNPHPITGANLADFFYLVSKMVEKHRKNLKEIEDKSADEIFDLKQDHDQEREDNEEAYEAACQLIRESVKDHELQENFENVRMFVIGFTITTSFLPSQLHHYHITIHYSHHYHITITIVSIFTIIITPHYHHTAITPSSSHHHHTITPFSHHYHIHPLSLHRPPPSPTPSLKGSESIGKNRAKLSHIPQRRLLRCGQIPPDAH
jgi:hypothetical protein